MLTGEGPEGLWDAVVAMLAKRGYGVERQQYGSENGRTNYAARLVTSPLIWNRLLLARPPFTSWLT